MPSKIQLTLRGSLCLFMLVFYSCREKPEPGTKEFIKKITAGINDKTLLDADKDSADWLSYGRNYSEDRYSPLVQIKIDLQLLDFDQCILQFSSHRDLQDEDK